MPKLLQFNVTANCGSTGRLAEDIGDVALSNGWESYIAYGREMAPSRSNLIKIGNKSDVYSHVLKTRLFDRHGFGSYRSTKTLIQYLQTLNPDVIQFHNIHGYYLNLPTVLEYIATNNIPLVWSLHDCWSMTGHCSHFALEGCEKWKHECYDCPLKNKYPQSWLLDSSRRNFRDKKKLVESIPNLTIVAVSEWIADIARESYFKNRPIHVIPNGVDTNVFYPKSKTNELRQRYGLEGKFVIMASGTVWLPYKGIKDYGMLREILPDDFAIILVGLSGKDFNNLPKGVIGLPRTKSIHELAELYSMADCVMSLSRLESFGLTPVEGFACGTPAIVYDNVALSELITDDTGFKIPVGDIKAIKDALLVMRQLGKEYYSEKCRNKALIDYNKYECFGRYLQLYDGLIK